MYRLPRNEGLPLARVNSVLLVDFDNIYGATSEDVVACLPQWLLWLEDGALSPDRRRRTFLHKRVYWNLQFEKYRGEFEAAGFETFNCRAVAKRKISAGKSSADIVITMDAVQMAERTKHLDEMIILTTDSDFVPVVNRIQTPRLRVVTGGKETDPTYELYAQHADAVIHMGALKDAFGYQRTPRRWYQLRSDPPMVAPLSLQRERQSPLMNRVRTALAGNESEANGIAPELRQGADIVKSLGERLPDQVLSKTKIVRALSVIPDFTPAYQNGIRPWLGHKNFAAMLRHFAKIHPEIEVKSLGKGRVEVTWRDTASEPRPVPPAPERLGEAEPDARDPGGEDAKPAVRQGLTSPA